MFDAMRSHMHRHPLLGALACGVITCIAAPPVRSAESGQNADGGGCNGGRSLPAAEGEATTEEETTSDESTSETTETVGVCGDGKVDDREECDDGNAVDEDGCPSGAVGQCAAGRCGDGIVWAGMESCDDGNEVAGDGCEADCSATPAGECGNGVMEAGEGCDDGNAVDEDGCPSGAMGMCAGEAKCGDGILWEGVEGCDDGNEDEEDGCPSGAMGMCLAEASCGDGFAWEGVEGCDDGNAVEEDGCPSGAMGMCLAEASCGDGFLWEGMEGCDDGNGEDVDGCNNDCATPRWVFISSTNGPNNNANLGGVAGADAHCQGLADDAGLGGMYMAWLTGSDPEMAPATRFASTEFAGWYLLPTDPPTPVARGWEDLTTPNEDNPDNYLQAALQSDEYGVTVGDAIAWSNTNFDGTRTGDEHCMDWSQSDGDKNGQKGRSKIDVLGIEWTDNGLFPCNGGARFYCFQVAE